MFVASTLLEEGGVSQSASPAGLLKEAIHVISCGYEDKTDWGQEVSYICSDLMVRSCILVACRLTAYLAILESKMIWRDSHMLIRYSTVKLF